ELLTSYILASTITVYAQGNGDSARALLPYGKLEDSHYEVRRFLLPEEFLFGFSHINLSYFVPPL
ncbi:hypothetical protein OAH05_02820, partial [bacterium]|nr:hypothetical protein [bacterium]